MMLRWADGCDEQLAAPQLLPQMRTMMTWKLYLLERMATNL